MPTTKTSLGQIGVRSAKLSVPCFSRAVSFGVALLLLAFPTTWCKAQFVKESDPTYADTNLILNPTPNSPTADIVKSAQGAGPDNAEYKFQDILALEKQGQLAAALDKATAAVQAEPKSVSPYIVRGHIYSAMGLWDKAGDDYRTILQIDPDNFSAQFNLSEVKLMQKDYDNARPGFLALEKNPDWGDLAAYKVFVCDLFAGHDDAAQSEFDAFNKAGSKASYYFANATWNFYRKQPGEAQTWLDTAGRIYPHKKIFFYSATLVGFGYIPPVPQGVRMP